MVGSDPNFNLWDVRGRVRNDSPVSQCIIVSIAHVVLSDRATTLVGLVDIVRLTLLPKREPAMKSWLSASLRARSYRGRRL